MHHRPPAQNRQHPSTLHLLAFQSLALAILLFFAGHKVAEHWGVVRRYSLPELLVGGLFIAIVNVLMMEALL